MMPVNAVTVANAVAIAIVRRVRWRDEPLGPARRHAGTWSSVSGCRFGGRSGDDDPSTEEDMNRGPIGRGFGVGGRRWEGTRRVLAGWSETDLVRATLPHDSVRPASAARAGTGPDPSFPS